MDQTPPPAPSPADVAAIARLDRLFEQQRVAFAAQPAPSAVARELALRRVEDALRARQVDIAAAISADFGHRSAHETRLLEIFTSIEGLRHARRHVAGWMRAQRRAVSLWFQPGSAAVLPQPLGVVGIIVPWNFPIFLAIGPLTAALAAGNRVMIKMSELTPRTGSLLAALLRQLFEEDQVAVVEGGPEVAAAFSRKPWDHLLFTGSTAVGRHVMHAAADNLCPVTLELGGKSPVIIGPAAGPGASAGQPVGFALEAAAASILRGKALNAGQACVAPDYLLLPAAAQDGFVEAARRVVARSYPEFASNPDYTSIVSDRHHARLLALLDDARAKGATIVPLASAPAQAPALPRRIPPTLVLDVHDDMRIMQEEIFGPLLPVVRYGDLTEAIAFVNARPRPLALYVFDRNAAHVARVLRETTAGGVAVNETTVHVGQDDLPFGGVGPSGMGRYHGRAGFETFSNRKGVFEQARWNTLALLDPPWRGARGAWVERLLKRMIG